MEEKPDQMLLALFDAHADELFRRSLDVLKDRRQAVLLTQTTFIEVWDRMAAGGTMRVRDLFGVLDTLLENELNAVTYEQYAHPS